MRSPLMTQLVEMGLTEDLGFGDITTDSLFKASHTSTAVLRSRQSAVLSGVQFVCDLIQEWDPTLTIECHMEDGDAVAPHTDIMTLRGSTASILKVERLTLNFLQYLSGIATLTYQYVGAVAGTSAKITHTRKTLPGYRSLVVQAVLHGGGSPHRFSLSHAAMIKDNHIQAAGSLMVAVTRLREHVGHTVKLEVECDTLKQVEDALKLGVDLILLDNMSLSDLEAAVAMAKGKAVLEASGGISLKNVADVAKTGVDIISTSQITLNAPAADLAVDFIDA